MTDRSLVDGPIEFSKFTTVKLEEKVVDADQYFAVVIRTDVEGSVLKAGQTLYVRKITGVEIQNLELDEVVVVNLAPTGCYPNLAIRTFVRHEGTYIHLADRANKGEPLWVSPAIVIGVMVGLGARRTEVPFAQL